jgi:hypothetical protein
MEWPIRVIGLGVAAIVANRSIRNGAPHHVGIDARHNAAAVDTLRQFVHTPIDQADPAAEQVGASHIRRIDLGIE